MYFLNFKRERERGERERKKKRKTDRDRQTDRQTSKDSGYALNETELYYAFPYWERI